MNTEEMKGTSKGVAVPASRPFQSGGVMGPGQPPSLSGLEVWIEAGSEPSEGNYCWARPRSDTGGAAVDTAVVAVGWAGPAGALRGQGAAVLIRPWRQRRAGVTWSCSLLAEK